MLLESLDMGAVGIAGDIPKNTSILPPGYPTFDAGDAVALARQFAVVLAWRVAARADSVNIWARWRWWRQPEGPTHWF